MLNKKRSKKQKQTKKSRDGMVICNGMHVFCFGKFFKQYNLLNCKLTFWSAYKILSLYSK